MGSWGTGIFDDDLAYDIESAFEYALSEGLTIPDATNRVLDNFDPSLDEDDEAVTYLVLGALQLEYNDLQQDIKERALNIIETGQDLARWEGADEDTVVERQQILEKLKVKLLKYKPNQEAKPPVKGQARKSFQELRRIIAEM